jgi:hypothetical protein
MSAIQVTLAIGSNKFDTLRGRGSRVLIHFSSGFTRGY